MVSHFPPKGIQERTTACRFGGDSGCRLLRDLTVPRRTAAEVSSKWARSGRGVGRSWWVRRGRLLGDLGVPESTNLGLRRVGSEFPRNGLTGGQRRVGVRRNFERRLLGDLGVPASDWTPSFLGVGSRRTTAAGLEGTPRGRLSDTAWGWVSFQRSGQRQLIHGRETGGFRTSARGSGTEGWARSLCRWDGESRARRFVRWDSRGDKPEIECSSWPASSPGLPLMIFRAHCYAVGSYSHRHCSVSYSHHKDGGGARTLHWLRTHEKPTAVKQAGGREATLPCEAGILSCLQATICDRFPR